MKCLLPFLFCLGLSAQSLPFPGPGMLAGAGMLTRIGSGSANNVASLTIPLTQSVPKNAGIITVVQYLAGATDYIANVAGTNYGSIENEQTDPDPTWQFSLAVLAGQALYGPVSSITINASSTGDITAQVYMIPTIAFVGPQAHSQKTITQYINNPSLVAGNSLSVKCFVLCVFWTIGNFNTYSATYGPGYTGYATGVPGVLLEWEEVSSGTPSATITYQITTQWECVLIAIKE